MLKGIEKLDDNPWVITGRKEGARLTDLQHPWRRIRARAGLPDVRIHDLRHSYASGALALGEGLPMIGKLLGHTQVQTTARYVRHLIPLAFLAPDIVEAILTGTQPVHLTAEILTNRIDLPLTWSEQKALLSIE